jgi:RNA polymerase sigma factor (sigma-70 family)
VTAIDAPSGNPGTGTAATGRSRGLGRLRAVGPDAGDAYRLLAPAVLGYLRGQGVEDPEDLMGEVFFQVSRSIGTFRGDTEDLRRWVFTIARNRAIDDRRRRARRPVAADVEVPDRATPPVELVDPELVDALAALTPDQREVVGLRFVADLSLDDVATITERPVGAVKSMQHRALGRLARTLAGEPDVDEG